MGLSFLRGLVAAVNPCAFVLLPTYLMYFLGMQGHEPGDQRASVRRALYVSGAVSAGFMSVFVAVGLLSEYSTRWVEEHARYSTFVIGLAFVVLGVAMLGGYRLPMNTPRLSTATTDRTVRAMFVYGVAYALASIGCTLPLFTASLFGNVSANGWGSGLANVLAYGAGIALILTALTIALAVANTGLLQVLRGSTRFVEPVTSVLVTVSGFYLLYYFFVVEVNEDSTPITTRIDELQRSIQNSLNDRWEFVAILLALILAAAIMFIRTKQRERSTDQTGSEISSSRRYGLTPNATSTVSSSLAEHPDRSTEP
jgi:cytochrome c-type biogenesis protein